MLTPNFRIFWIIFWHRNPQHQKQFNRSLLRPPASCRIFLVHALPAATRRKCRRAPTIAVHGPPCGRCGAPTRRAHVPSSRFRGIFRKNVEKNIEKWRKWWQNTRKKWRKTMEKNDDFSRRKNRVKSLNFGPKRCVPNVALGNWDVEKMYQTWMKRSFY